MRRKSNFTGKRYFPRNHHLRAVLSAEYVLRRAEWLNKGPEDVESHDHDEGHRFRLLQEFPDQYPEAKSDQETTWDN